jgi:hypothetical protein
MEHWQNDTGEGEQEDVRENWFLYHFFFHKSNTVWPGIDPKTLLVEFCEGDREKKMLFINKALWLVIGCCIESGEI